MQYLLRRVLVSVLLVGSLVCTTGIAHAQPSNVVTATPTTLQAQAGQTPNFTITVSSGGTAVSGSVWINAVATVPDGVEVFSASNQPQTKTPLNASGQATLALPSLTTAGSYTVDICYFANATSACEVHSNVLSVTITAASISNPPSGTPTTGGATQGAVVSLPNPIACDDATCLISQVIRYVLGIVAVIATLMFVWGGVLMLTSGGNADQVRKAKETLVWATIGIIVILMSWVIIRFVLEAVVGTGSSG